jgi:hypothetical protein
MALIFLSGPMMKTDLTVALSAVTSLDPLMGIGTVNRHSVDDYGLQVKRQNIAGVPTHSIRNTRFPAFDISNECR